MTTRVTHTHQKKHATHLEHKPLPIGPMSTCSSCPCNQDCLNSCHLVSIHCVLPLSSHHKLPSERPVLSWGGYSACLVGWMHSFWCFISKIAPRTHMCNQEMQHQTYSPNPHLTRQSKMDPSHETSQRHGKTGTSKVLTTPLFLQ